jgi:hypothetical protein
MVYLRDPYGKLMYAALSCTQASIDHPISLDELAGRHTGLKARHVGNTSPAPASGARPDFFWPKSRKEQLRADADRLIAEFDRVLEGYRG